MGIVLFLNSINDLSIFIALRFYLTEDDIKLASPVATILKDL